MELRASIDENGFFVGVTECQESPLEPGVFLIPANSAPMPENLPGENQIMRFKDNKWETLPDYTKFVYYHKTTGLEKVFERGEEFDDSYTDKNPGENLYIRRIFCGVFIDGNWVLDEEKAYNASIPQVITLRQFHLALLQTGDYDDVLEAVSQAPRSIQIEFNTAQTVRRDWPSLLAMASQLGWTSLEIDEVFLLGEAL